MSLKNMKLTKKETRNILEGPSSPGEDMPRYPWGLRITLDTETIAKLGIKMPLDVGEKCSIVAKGEVVAVSANESQGGGKRESLDIQITDMSVIEGDSEKKDDASKKLYGA